jgi:hypothetical protein
MKAKCLSLFLAMSLLLALASCDNGTTSDYNVPGSTLAEKLDWLQVNVKSGDSYVIDISADEIIAPGQRFEYTGKNNITITLRGSGRNRTINLSNNGNMFVVRTGVTLVLDNITLRGRSFNSNSLISVRAGAALQMNGGTVIIGNTCMNSTGGGVWVEGTFTMNGGTITGNAAEIDGGGVAVAGGSFTMNGGTITGNNANNGGGGVAVLSKGTFVMKGGTISGNNARYGGGGVAAQYGNFTMSGGTISGNISESEGGGVIATNARSTAGTVLGIGNFIMNGGTVSGNTARTNGGGVAASNEGTFILYNGSITGNTGTRGGGAAVSLNSTFTMSGGNISGNTAKDSGGGVYVWGVFTKTGGTITGYISDRRNGNVVSNSRGIAEKESGHAVYAYYSGSRVTKRKESTAGSGTDLSYAGRTGSFSGEWDY